MLTPNVVDEATIETVWGNAIRDRSIQRFATTAERDAQWPPATAGEGAVCMVGSVLHISSGTAWTAFTAKTDVPYQNAWTFIPGWPALQATRVGDIVTVGGTIYGGALGTVVFLLPVGFRPFQAAALFPYVSGFTIGNIDLRANGQGSALAGGGASGHLNISFRGA